MNIYGNLTKNETPVYIVDNYINKDINESSTQITSSGLKVVVLGDGQKVIKQSPSEGTILNPKNKVFLLTPSNEYKMPDIIGWSRSDIEVLCKLLDINVKFDGFGYATETNIKEGEVITKETSLEVKLENKYREEEKKEDE